MKITRIYELILLICISMVFSCGSNDVEKAKEFMAAGMFPQAIELLNKRVQEKPDDAEAHFQLGVCYINTGNFHGADQRFASAIRLKPDYGFQIGGKYYEVGKEMLAKNEIQKAEHLFSKAIEFQRDLIVDVSRLYDEKTDPKAIISGLKFRKQAIPQNGDLIESQEKALRLLASKSSVKEMRKIVPQYGEMLAEDVQKEIAPPARWQEVPESVRTIIGKGLNRNGEIELKRPLAQTGDKYFYRGRHYQWKSYSKGIQWIDKYGEIVKGPLTSQQASSIRSYPSVIRIPKGEKVVTGLLRKM